LKVGVGVSEGVARAIERNLRSAKCKVEIFDFTSPQRLVRSLKDGDVDAAVRGTLRSSEIIRQLKKSYSLREVMRTAVLEDSRGRQFLLMPVGIDEGSNYRSRKSLVMETLSFFSPMDWKLSVGILSKGRSEDRNRGSGIRRSLEEGERMVKDLRLKGIDAKHFEILIEKAAKESDLVVAPDGVSGNLIFRSMHFLGGTKAYGAPVVNIPDVFVDTSRAKADFTDSVLLAAGLARARARLKL